MTPDAPEFLAAHPELESLDLLLPDLNGIARGKSVSIASAAKCLSEGILLPRSVFAGDICGDTVDATGLGIFSGDMDYACRVESGTLRAVPWSARPSAQCMMEMMADDGRPWAVSPRQVLRRVVERLDENGLFPTVAVELEFYLFQDRLDAGGRPQLILDPVTGEASQSTQVYSIDDLDNSAPFIDTVRRWCAIQRIPASAAVAEYAPGQFEINLDHRDDVIGACDDAFCLKRIVRHAARAHGCLASFMAKPVAGQTGCGMHIHVSVADANGANRFAAQPGELQHAIGGLQASMHPAMLLFAPHANSYRRFQPGAYVPLSPAWGYNNRSVALRVPAGPDSSRRIEHRLAGADANPYLVMAAVLAGILHGHRRGIAADAPVEGDAAGQRDASLPTDWRQAIDLFRDSDWVTDYLSRDFQSLYATVKHSEYERYQGVVPPLDIQWYLQLV